MKPTLIKIAEPPTSDRSQARADQTVPYGLPLLRLGMRPFYLGAAAFAAISIPLWVAINLGAVSLRLPVAPLLWHAHEMLFGFAAAVIIGFLLSAGKAWTGLTVARGPALGLLALLWLAARLTAVTGPHLLYAFLDLVLLPVVAVRLAIVLTRAGSRRNLPLVALLSLLAGANAAFHLATLDIINGSALRALYAGLALIIMIECVMAGRVIPAFTMGATPGLRLPAPGKLEWPTLAITLAALAAWVFALPGAASAALLGLAAVLQVHRCWRWQPWVTRGRPILWILHAAYAWIPLGLGLLALAQWGVIGVSPGIHALAVGATGGLIIGMITRTARGHTGRPLQISGAEVTAYSLVLSAAALRALVPLASSEAVVLVAAAAAWSSAFALYLWIYVPWLSRTRADGKDG